MKVKKESRIFYAPHLKAVLGDCLMSQEESHHLIKVLRLGVGDAVEVVNGHGLLVKAKIKDANKKSCVIDVEKIVEQRAQESLLTLAIAPTKNIDRFEWFLEKATEIGVGSIFPFIGDHSERKVIKNDRLDKIIVSAMKQSGRLWKPRLNGLVKFSELMDNDQFTEKYIAHCHDNMKMEPFTGHGKPTIILIGPEGGFSTQELTLSSKNGYNGLSLGDYRLRSETAGIVACHVYNQH